MEVSTYLPVFPGFYGTIFEVQSSNIYWELVSLIQESGINMSAGGAEILLDSAVVAFDYDGYDNEYLEQMVESVSLQLSDRLPIELAFEYVQRPKEYNFKNDVGAVKATIKFEEFKEQLLSLIRANKDCFNTFIRKRFTSGPGFVSFHSDDGNKWLQELIFWKKGEGYDPTRFGSLLEFVLIAVDGYDQEALYRCTEAPSISKHLSGKLIDTLNGDEIPKLWVSLSNKADEYCEMMFRAGNRNSSSVQLKAHYCNLAEVMIETYNEEV